MINLKLKRQQYALKCIIEVGKNKAYKSAIESFGLMVYKNSLISAMAVTKDKEKNLYKHISGWLKIYPFLKTKFNNVNDILNGLVNLSSTELMVLTEEVLLLSDALKEFAKAEIKD